MSGLVYRVWLSVLCLINKYFLLRERERETRTAADQSAVLLCAL